MKKKKLFLNKKTIANLNENVMGNIKGGRTQEYCYKYTGLCNVSHFESCATNGCAYQTIDEPDCADPTFTAQGGVLCGPGCFPV